MDDGLPKSSWFNLGVKIGFGHVTESNMTVIIFQNLQPVGFQRHVSLFPWDSWLQSCSKSSNWEYNTIIVYFTKKKCFDLGIDYLYAVLSFQYTNTRGLKNMKISHLPVHQTKNPKLARSPHIETTFRSRLVVRSQHQIQADSCPR